MRCVLVRYHEIALKKGNRPYFLRRLKQNVALALRGLGVAEIKTLPGRLAVLFDREPDEAEVARCLRSVFGIANFSFAERTAPDLEALKARILDSLDGARFGSFRVAAKRADKSFPMTSPEINRSLGAAVKAKTGMRVDLEAPELTIEVEILPHEAFFALNRIQGPGGLPVGVTGKVLALISGGIDSPVAAYRMMQRGCRVAFVHFHGAPYLDRTSQDKVRALVRLLVRHQFSARLYLVPFGEIQRQIVAAVLRPLRVVLYRRMMLRIAEGIARRERAQALVTGESLAQVASQTLENLAVIGEATALPVLRPLVGMDKQEIVDQARAIETFEISTIPDQDCCQLFVPAHPATKANLAEVRKAEELFDVAAMTELGLKGASVEEFHLFDPKAARESPESDPQ
ncbi:MAG TPA: tRNA uracil 4-sulfurtransferase ThiI [Candidatus Acidoferrales bacterium]|nr:tRNA uracil 4-sulfurtransferase ThiI [Candidatus Acidoferrales bacterium]